MYQPSLSVPVIRKETPFSTREYNIEESIQNTADRIKSFCSCTLFKKFRMPVIIDNTTARVIAYANMSGGFGEIWLDGKPVDQKSLRLRLVLEYPQDSTTYSKKRQETQGEELGNF